MMSICKATCLLSFVFAFEVQALPNYWSFESGQGYDNYSIISKNNKTQVSISCGEMAASENRVFVTQGKIDRDSTKNDFEFLIDGETFFVPRDTNYRNGANDWRKFFEAISTTNSFSVYRNNKLIANFSPPTRNVQKVFKDAVCTPKFDWNP